MSRCTNKKTVLVTGGAGYVGSSLIPKLLEKEYFVKVIDLYIYGDNVLDECKQHSNLEQIKGDIRNTDLLKSTLENCDSVIHLACISNDPSCELNPDLTKSINYDAFINLVNLCKEKAINKFIFASSGSVYGISSDPNVTENNPKVPVSLYNQYKACCEDYLADKLFSHVPTVIIRPATVCGYSPRQRLDLTVNLLTNQAFNSGRITVFGGTQVRPNIHIEDMSDLYVKLLALPDDKIAGKIYNAGYENNTVLELAKLVKDIVQQEVPERSNIELITTESNDPRSYYLCSEKIKQELDFTPKKTIRDGVKDLINAFEKGKIPNSLTDIKYYNIKLMQSINLK